jgi:hypothetical protein
MDERRNSAPELATGQAPTWIRNELENAEHIPFDQSVSCDLERFYKISRELAKMLNFATKSFIN